MPFKTVVVEDEQPSMQRLCAMLAEFAEIELCAQVYDGLSAVETINRLQPDAVFLDIHLPELDGFEVLSRLICSPQIIFVTAYDQYAIQAFEQNAIDYLLKPTTSARLAQAVAKLAKMQLQVDARTLQILRSVMQQTAMPQRFCVKIGDEILFFPSEDVHYFHAADKYVFLHSFAKEFIYDATLKDLQDSLPANQFIRIHKSVIVAVNKIAKIRRSFSGKYIIQLADQQKSKFEIGKTFLPMVRQQLQF